MLQRQTIILQMIKVYQRVYEEDEESVESMEEIQVNNENNYNSYSIEISESAK